MDTRDLVLYGLRATGTRALRSIDDVTDDEARRRPGDNLASIIWQLGHLALADKGNLERMGVTSSLLASFTDLFKTGTGGPAAYPPLGEVRTAFEQGQFQLESAAQEADLSQVVEARNFGTVGEMLIFACYHRGYHIGKMATLRALFGKPRLFG
ncbi:MAG TPA: DinB family protein [bacterium]|jgi:uncharacterized damage-inducible protein DinB